MRQQKIMVGSFVHVLIGAFWSDRRRAFLGLWLVGRELSCLAVESAAVEVCVVEV